MDKKYFRMMESPDENWGAYQYAFIYGAKENLNSHRDTKFLSAPEVGDYLVLGEDGKLSALCPTSFEKYNGVFYADIPSLEKLLDDGVVVEVPEDIQELDWKLQARIEALEGAIDELEENLEELEPKMNKRRFLFLTQEARDSQHIYNELKLTLDGLCQELDEVRVEMEKKVTKPLEALVDKRQELLHASVDDLIFGASARGVEVLGLKKDFDIERDFSI